MSAFDPNLAKTIETGGIIAVLIIENPEDAPPLAEALYAGGVRAMELTLRTPSALDALRAVRKEVPEMIAGVGTILTPEQILQAKDAGATFGVSPGLNPRVLEAAAKAGLSFAPGIATPSDIERALEYGCQLLKFFPAEPSGGMTYLKAIAAPYAHLNLRYIPLGGLHAKNMSDYLSSPLVPAIGGSWLAPKDLIKAKDWKQIQSLAQTATQTISQLRKL